MALVAATFSGCAALRPEQQRRIIDTASGLSVKPATAASRMRHAEIVLLGELHDNAHHHARRSALILALGTPATAVVEHWPRGAAPRLPAGLGRDVLCHALAASGFDAKGRRWTQHEPLFAAIARAGMPPRGGNLERNAVQQLARVGAGARPADLAPWINAAPLKGIALAAQRVDLMQGHCGHLIVSREPGMIVAQQTGGTATCVATTVCQRC